MFVRVKHKNHGGIASLPEEALGFFPDWEPVEGPLPAKPKAKRELPHAAPAASAKESE